MAPVLGLHGIVVAIFCGPWLEAPHRQATGRSDAK
jgi:hypothetical protein